MVTLAEMRRESVSKEGLKVYATILAQYEHRHVAAVLERLGRTPRKEYEKAIPELGELEELVKQETAKVRNQENPFRPCGRCINGHIFVKRYVEEYRNMRSKGMETFVADCECRKAWLESRKVSA